MRLVFLGIVRNYNGSYMMELEEESPAISEIEIMACWYVGIPTQSVGISF